MGVNAAQLWCETMKPAQNVVNAGGLRTSFRFGASQQYDRDAGRAGGGNFAIGYRAARIFGDQNIDVFGREQRGFLRFGKRPPRQDQAMWNSVFCKDVQPGWRINGADEVKMLRRTGEFGQIQPAMGEKNALGSQRQGADRSGNRINFLPDIAALLFPRRTGQLNQRNLRCRTRERSVTRHLTGKRMGGIDNTGDVVRFEIGYQAFNTAKATAAKRHGLARRLCAASERQGRMKFALKRLRQRACLGGAAQNQNMALPGLLLIQGIHR